MSLTGAIMAVLALKRTCPKCGREQLVSKDEKHKSVKCKFCETTIPPKKKL
jgi:transcription elongation factor Elf1